ncbi:MAG: GIY-YIG nuclease family protein [Kiritimatiellae bacterium]|nr:GIY-YIG nuclease family protein [Kiritimatiellia bacterium]
MDLSKAIENAEELPAAYVLQGSDDKYLYKGACRNLKNRIKSHKAGRCSRTKNRRPLTLVHFEYCEDYSAALKKERYWKSGRGRAWNALSSTAFNITIFNPRKHFLSCYTFIDNISL